MASPAKATTSPAKVRHIAKPRRLLILSPTSQSISIIPPLLHSLTGVSVQDPPQQQKTHSSSSEPTAPPQSTPTTTTFAGYTTHSPFRIETKYYSAEVPVWVDEIPLETEKPTTTTTTTTPTKTDASTNPTAQQWQTEFLSEEADIVRDAVGALVVCAHNPQNPNPDPSGGTTTADSVANRPDVRVLRELVRGVGAVKERIDEERGGVGDVPSVFVLVGGGNGAVSRSQQTPSSGSAQAQPDLDLGVDDADLGSGAEDAPLSVGWWEDRLFDMGLLGWEVVAWDPKEQSTETRRNQFGELEGMPRIKEVLETHDWTASSDDPHLDPDAGADFDDDLETELLGFGGSTHTRGFNDEVHELEREMLGLRMAIERGGGDGEEDQAGEDDEIKVESMEGLMMRMQAIRDMSSELPESERKSFAAKAVQDIMREI